MSPQFSWNFTKCIILNTECETGKGRKELYRAKRSQIFNLIDRLSAVNVIYKIQEVSDSERATDFTVNAFPIYNIPKNCVSLQVILYVSVAVQMWLCQLSKSSRYLWCMYLILVLVSWEAYDMYIAFFSVCSILMCFARSFSFLVEIKSYSLKILV